MMLKRWMFAAAMAGFLLAGCDEPKSTPKSVSQAPAQVATLPAIPPAEPVSAPAARTVEAPATQPAPAVATSSFRIYETMSNEDPGQLYEFPCARLHISKADNSAVLYSDDPKTAIDPNYGGNSYYLVIRLDRDEPMKLDGYKYPFKTASTAEHQDSTDGVFLSGLRYHLQPSDTTVYFRGNGPKVEVAVMGQFLRFDTASTQNSHVGVPVFLKGVVTATLDVEK